MAELQNRLNHAEMVNRERRADVLDLSQRLIRMVPESSGDNGIINFSYKIFLPVCALSLISFFPFSVPVFPPLVKLIVPH